jgi:hypothetical protein
LCWFQLLLLLLSIFLADKIVKVLQCRLETPQERWFDRRERGHSRRIAMIKASQSLVREETRRMRQ